MVTQLVKVEAGTQIQVYLMPLQDIWSCPKHPLRHLVHAKRSLLFSSALLQDSNPDASVSSHHQPGCQGAKG